MLSRQITDRLQRFDTPFYLYDLDLLRETLRQAREIADGFGYRIHYAMKANFEPRILSEVRAFGMGIDAVSGNEVRAAVEAGFPASEIVFAGVGKSDREIRYGIEQGIFAFNCESRQELEVIDALARETGSVARVALRINPDVHPDTHKHISTGQADSKFGISYKEIDELTARLAELRHVEITGLHFHIGSQIRNLNNFVHLCERVNVLWKWFSGRGFRFTHVNLGGGLGIDYDDPDGEPIPDFAAYFSVFAEHLDIPEGIGVHFELGRSLVGQCGELISRVLYDKTTAGGKEVAVIDASMTELIRPALYQAHHAIENLNGNGREEKSYIIGGPVCESSDVFARDLVLPELRRGDLVTLKSAGAYGTAMASRYNLHDLPASVYSDQV